MKVVVSIGGSVLAPDLDADRVADYADAIQSLDARRHTTRDRCRRWPGRVFVGSAGIGRERDRLDQLGIAVTRLNGRLLIAALDDRAAPTPAESYDEGREAIRRGDIPVLGGIVAAQTTDAVAAAFAEYVGADLLVYATSVPGVYNADPNEDDDATRFDELGADELVDVIADIEMDAGSSAPVDLLAAKIIQRSGIRTMVLDGTDPERVVRAVEDGEFDGSEILPEA
ncbi:UMP kinase [Halogeometricum sp. wsp3]|nr:UMP kinase [Halogeometricum sp. wsp3]